MADADLRADLRLLLDAQISDERSGWEMRADGSYVQRLPEGEDKGKSAQESLISLYGDRFKEATRLKRRTPRGIAGRNLR